MHNSTILVVDDEPNNLQLMRQLLREHFQLFFARNGQQALELANRYQPNLILLDVMMPEMDGYQTCEVLKRSPLTRNIPVIFVTAMNDAVDEQKGLDLGAVDYITKPISPAILLSRVRTHLSLVRVEQLEASYTAAIQMLGEAGHYNDTDTGAHIWRMADYSASLAKLSGWSQEDCDQLQLAAPMHDTGKIGIPDNILKKPGKLDKEEWRIMQTHAKIGHEILIKSSAPLFQLAAEIALNHHEKWDGSGYPNQLKEEEIPESARIVALCDVFDALSTKRPYKEAWPLDKCWDEIANCAGKHFDPRLAELFLDNRNLFLDIKEQWSQRTGENCQWFPFDNREEHDNLSKHQDL